MITEKFSVRRMLPEEWKEFSILRLQALTECPRVFGSSLQTESAYTETDWRSWLNNDKKGMFGLFYAGKLVGITGVVPDWDGKNEGVMVASYILPEYRGKGLASHLYRARIDWAASNTAWDKLTVGHRDGNEASRCANQRHGFHYTHREPKTWPDGTSGDHLYYELDLEPLRQKQ